MYAGSTINNFSGVLLGAHQRIDRMARRQVKQLGGDATLPGIRQILCFEGNNGPDGVKRKSPAHNEPWHFLQPFDTNDTQLIELVADHYRRLVAALTDDDNVRASFEAAWIAHAIVDGLTPAHHYPYDEKLVEIRGGVGNEGRDTIGKKLIMPGATRTQQVSNNMKMWGPKGLFTTHAAFEWGVAVILLPMQRIGKLPNSEQLKEFQSQPIDVWFREQAQRVARMQLYDAFYDAGWTISLSRRVRNQLIPILVQSVALVWHGALEEAKAAKK